MIQNRFSALIITSTIAITIIGCQSLSSIFQANASPSSTVKEFIASIAATDTNKAYDLPSENYKSKLGGQKGLQLEMKNLMSFVDAEDLNASEITYEKTNGDTATVSALLGKEKQLKSQFGLIEEEGKWKIDRSGSP
jgi:NTF2-like N-terminal transpeptidase domain